jgi:hypothetical protein
MWNGSPFETPVIPAKAGIHSPEGVFPNLYGIDSRFRGNDCDLQRSYLANDTGILRGPSIRRESELHAGKEIQR